jgi:uncharacterized protein YqeY
MSALKEQINADIKTALKAGDRARVSTLRSIMAAFKQVEVDSRVTLDDAAVIGILTKLASQRKESITQFDAAQRTDLADKERAELVIIENYLPAPLDTAEVDALIAEAIAKIGATQMKDMGRVMNELRPRLVGRADLAAVSATVKARLTG